MLMNLHPSIFGNSRYEGSFVKVPHGQGTKTWHTHGGGNAARVYTGAFVKGAKHGKGAMVFQTTGNMCVLIFIQRLCLLYTPSHFTTSKDVTIVYLFFEFAYLSFKRNPANTYEQ